MCKPSPYNILHLRLLLQKRILNRGIRKIRCFCCFYLFIYLFYFGWEGGHQFDCLLEQIRDSLLCAMILYFTKPIRHLGARGGGFQLVYCLQVPLLLFPFFFFFFSFFFRTCCSGEVTWRSGIAITRFDLEGKYVCRSIYISCELNMLFHPRMFVCEFESFWHSRVLRWKIQQKKKKKTKKNTKHLKKIFYFWVVKRRISMSLRWMYKNNWLHIYIYIYFVVRWRCPFLRFMSFCKKQLH